MNVGSGHYAVLAGLVFCIGLFGVTTRRQAFLQVIALAVMFAAPVIAIAGFSQTQAMPRGDNDGVAVALAMLGSLTAEAACAAAVLILLARRRHSLDLDSVEHLQG